MNLEHQGITKREVHKGNVGVAGNDAKFLTSFDHQLIFHIMYGVRQFYHRQKRGEESWPKNNWWLPKKLEQLLPKTVEMKKIAKKN